MASECQAFHTTYGTALVLYRVLVARQRNRGKLFLHRTNSSSRIDASKSRRRSRVLIRRRHSFKGIGELVDELLQKVSQNSETSNDLSTESMTIEDPIVQCNRRKSVTIPVVPEVASPKRVRHTLALPPGTTANVPDIEKIQYMRTKRPRVVVHFCYGKESALRQTQALQAFECPWCDLKTGGIAELLFHLRLNHNRFTYECRRDRKTGECQITIVSCDDWCEEDRRVDAAIRVGRTRARVARSELTAFLSGRRANLPTSAPSRCSEDSPVKSDTCHDDAASGDSAGFALTPPTPRDSLSSESKSVPLHVLQKRYDLAMADARGVKDFFFRRHGWMPTFDDARIDDVSVADCNDCDESEGSGSTSRKRTYYHSETFMPIEPDDSADSEDERCTGWLEDTLNKLIDDLADVNDGEKKFMKLWNGFQRASKPQAVAVTEQQHVYGACLSFTQQYGLCIWTARLRNNYVLHLTSLFDNGLLSADGLTQIIQALASMK